MSARRLFFVMRECERLRAAGHQCYDVVSRHRILYACFIEVSRRVIYSNEPHRTQATLQ